MTVVVHHVRIVKGILLAISAAPKTSASIIHINNSYKSAAHDKQIPCGETFLTAVSCVTT